MRGDSGNDVVLGDLGHDELGGGEGDDYLGGSAGDDGHQEAPATTACSTALATTGMGDDGRDEVSFEPMTAPVLVDLPAGTVTSDVSSETISLVEVVIATTFSDEVIGDSADNRLVGLRRLDRLLGGDGQDLIEGGSGNDAMNGGAGSTRPRTWKAESGHGRPAGRLRRRLRLGLVAIENVIGSAFSDYLRGDSLPNLLEAFGSDDILEGRGGDDALDGGEGADAGDGGDGSDNCVAVEFRTSCES